MLMVRVERGGGINWEIGIDIYILLYIKEVNNKGLLYSTGNNIQYSVMTYMGSEKVKVKVAQLHPTLWDPMDFSRPEYWSG